MFKLSGVNYEEVLEQRDSILVRVIAISSYRGFELSGFYYSFFPATSNSWNHLSTLIKCSPTLNVFKKRYMDFFNDAPNPVFIIQLELNILLVYVLASVIFVCTSSITISETLLLVLVPVGSLKLSNTTYFIALTTRSLDLSSLLNSERLLVS